MDFCIRDCVTINFSVISSKARNLDESKKVFLRFITFVRNDIFFFYDKVSMRK